MGNRYSNVKRGRAFDLSDGNYYHSGWERDVARFLNLLWEWKVVSGWEYEPQTFYFTDFEYKRGPWVYKPDFVVRYEEKIPEDKFEVLDIIFDQVIPGISVYWEVKGQETGKDRSKWRRFKTHVGAPLEIVPKEKMRLIETAFKPYIPNWESRIT